MAALRSESMSCWWRHDWGRRWLSGGGVVRRGGDVVRRGADIPWGTESPGGKAGNMISRCLVTLLCLLTSRVSGERSASVRSAGDAGELIEDLDYGSLPDGITSDTVVVTYFYDSEHHSADTGHQLLKKLSKYFRRRPEVDIRLCKVSCTGETGQFCRRHLVNRAVHAFRQGHPRVTLSLTGPSPLDAAIATSLHLWLAERVAVLNTAQELAELQTRCRGRCNILTAYFPSLGASEHRLLLEAALDENTAEETTDDVTNRLQFVMTSSEEAVVDLPPPLYQSLEDQTELLSPRLWMLLCGGGGDGEPLGTPGRCHAAGFHWELSAEELRHFLRASTRPGWVKAAGAVSARELPFDLRRTHVTLLLTDVTSLGRVTAAAPALGTLFRGSVGFVILDLDSWPAESLAEFGLDREHLYLPSLAFITRGMETASAVLNEYDDAVGFIQSQLIKYLKQVERQQRAETEWDDLQLRTDNVPAVLKQDDELELLLTDEDDFSPVREIGDEEFNTLSRSDEFAVLVAYLPCPLRGEALLAQVEDTVMQDISSPVGRQARQQYQLTSARALVAVNLTSGQVVKYAGPGSAEPVLHWADRVLGGYITGEVLLKSESWLPVLPPIDFSSSRRTESVPTAEADTLDIMDDFQGAADGMWQCNSHRIAYRRLDF
ncbi:hypothetical protein FJT64_025525 [Amphibalanus amphitrite]|uniref:Thioredoxin domain-containing protein 16 n=1 Tax=Amphibalanus amphitrite TaxID=1232801 RepID=A0A6A4WJN3_AMPAM|nr:hypothetical protein FJT64_025525 [Amphibalanus amphitrite]